MHRAKSSLTQHQGALWKTPASPRAREWNVLLSLALPRVTTFNKYISLAAIACFLRKPSLYAYGREESVYEHDCSQNIGMCYTVLVLRLFFFLPGVAQILNYSKSEFFLSHQYSYFDFHHLYRSLETTTLQGFCAGSLAYRV